MTLRTTVPNVGIPDPNSEWEVETSNLISRAWLPNGRFQEIIQPMYESLTDEMAHENAVRKMRDPMFCRDIWSRLTDPYYYW